MEIEKVLKLIDAGFSADDIRGMMQPAEEPASPALTSPVDPEPTAAPAETPAAAEAPETDILSAVKNIVAEQIAAALTQQKEDISNLQRLAGMPALENVQAKGIEDVISRFFKEE